MRFLLLNQYYPPDTAPTGIYLHQLARALVQAGHRVEVLCSRGCYNGKARHPAHEIRDGVEVIRLSSFAFGRVIAVGKILDYASYYAALLCALVFGRRHPDLILSLTTPPYVGLLGKLAAKTHRCRHAHWIMDLYPDVMSAHGMLRKQSLAYSLLSQLTQFQLAGAERVIALGPTMAKWVAAYIEGRPRADVDWLPLWSDPELRPWPDDEVNPLRAQRRWPADDVVFLYSGNMGLGHRFSEFLLAAQKLGAAGPRWVFSGGGKRRPELETAAQELPQARIEFLDYVPQPLLRAHLCAADVHLASLDSAWQGMMVPSKLQGSFAVGRPVLYVGGRDCEAASWIRDSGGGWVIEQGDLKGLLSAIEQALDVDERRKRGQAALAFAQSHFNQEHTCARMIDLLEMTRSTRPSRWSQTAP